MASSIIRLRALHRGEQEMTDRPQRGREMISVKLELCSQLGLGSVCTEGCPAQVWKPGFAAQVVEL